MCFNYHWQSFRLVTAFTLVGCLAGSPASAAEYTWTGGGSDANWTTGDNWGGAAPAGVNTDAIHMAGATQLAPVVDTDGPWVLNELYFDSGAESFTLSGNMLRFAGSASVIVRNNSSATQTIENNIIIASSGSRYVYATSGDVVFNGNIDLTPGSMAFRGGHDVTLNGLITGTGSLGRTDPGTVYITNNANTFSGNISISHGVFEVASIADAGVACALGKGSVIGLSQTVWGPSDTGTLRYTGPTASTNRTIEMRSNEYSGGSTPNYDVPSGRPTLEVTDPDTTLTFTGDFEYATGSSSGRYWQLLGAGNGVIEGDITTTGAGIRKAGTGTWTLAGSNTYEGVTTVEAGILRVLHSNGLGTADGETIVKSGAQVQIDGGLSLNEAFTLSGEGQNYAGALRSTSGSNTLDGPITLDGFARLTAASGTLDVTGGVTGGSDTFVVNAHGSAVLSFTTTPVTLGETAQFYSDAGGTVALGVSGNTWGTTVVAGGTVRMDVADALPAASALAIGLGYSPNGTLDLNGFNQTVGELRHGTTNAGSRTVTSATAATLTVNQDVDSTYDGALTGSLAITKSGTGRLTLAGDSSYTGVTNVSAGTLRIQHNNALGATTGNTVVGTAGQLQLDGSAGALNIAEPITIDGSNNDGSWGGPLRNVAGDNTYSGPVTLVGTTRISQAGGSLLVTGGVTGSHSFTVNNGSGTITFADNPINLGNNDLSIHSGGTTVLDVASNTLRNVRIEWGGTLKLGVADALPAASVLMIGNSSSGTDYAGRFDLDGNSQTLAGLQNVGLNAANEVRNSSLTPATLTIDNTNDYTYASRVTGNLALGKSGVGTFTLGGENTYSGATTITGGTLALSHDTSGNTIASSPVIDIAAGASLDVTGLTGAGGFRLNSGQTLQGNGAVVGNLLMAAGSNLAPGISPGVLTVEGNLVQDSDATFLVELAGDGVAGADYDLVDVYGDASLDGWLDVSLLNGFAAELGDYFDVLTTTGSLDIAGLELTGDAPNPVFGWWDAAAVGGVDGSVLRLTAVPEPSGLLLALSALVGWLACRRRH